MKSYINDVLSRFIREEDGASAIEYGLIAALIAVVILGAVFTIGDELLTAFTNVSDCLESPSATC